MWTQVHLAVHLGFVHFTVCIPHFKKKETEFLFPESRKKDGEIPNYGTPMHIYPE